MADHSRLGRGLASLIGDVGEETPAPKRRASRAARRSRTCAPIRAIRAAPSPTPSSTSLPPRSASAASSSRSSCADARRGDTFEIIAGERRWRAAQRAGLHDVPIVVVEATDAQALEFAIIENVQRADLNPIEEAGGYRALMDEFNHTPGGRRADRRQEPAARRQHAAAAEAVRAGAGAGARRANFGRPRAAAGRPAERADRSPRSSTTG